MAGGRQGQLKWGVWALGHLRGSQLQAAVLCVVGLGASLASTRSCKGPSLLCSNQICADIAKCPLGAEMPSFGTNTEKALSSVVSLYGAVSREWGCCSDPG